MGATRLVSRRRQDQGFKWARIVIAVLATIGIIDTGSITLKRWGLLGNLNCPMGADGCDKVLNSAWGTVAAGIPLSFVGLLAYSAVLLLAVLPLLPGLQENKSELSRRTWWALFGVSLGMAVFSGVLLGLMVIKIQAFCFFCVLSGVLSLSIFILAIVGGGWDDLGPLIFRGILLALAVLMGGLIWASVLDPERADAPQIEPGAAQLVESVSSPAKLSLAEHLSSKGAVVYTAYWCSHCHDQKEMFGKEAVEALTVIECAPDGQNNQAELCKSKGVQGFPSWEIDGKVDSGVKPLETLAELSGYDGNTDF